MLSLEDVLLNEEEMQALFHARELPCIRNEQIRKLGMALLREMEGHEIYCPVEHRLRNLLQGLPESVLENPPNKGAS